MLHYLVSNDGLYYNQRTMTSPDDTNFSSSPSGLPTVESKKEKGFFRELLEFIVIALLIVVPFRIFIAQPYVVNGASMNPTFKDGEYLIVDQLSYRLSEPERGSIIIFRYPKDPSWYFIKRVIGLPGETISIRNGVVTIKNAENPEGFPLTEDYIKFEKKEDFDTELGSGEYFVLGDNRLGSADSRIWGSVPEANIVGRPLLRLLPLSRVDLWPGNEDSLGPK